MSVTDPMGVNPIVTSVDPPMPTPIPTPPIVTVPPIPTVQSNIVTNITKITGDPTMSTPLPTSGMYDPEKGINKELHKIEKNIIDVARQEFYETSNGIKELSTSIESFKDSTADKFAAVNLNATLAAQVSQSAITLAVRDLEATTLADGQKTRDLINSQYSATLAKELNEANMKLIEAKGDAKSYRRDCDHFQYNQISNAIAGFNNDLQSVRQGVINFGSMSGSAGTQTSTNNVVR